MKPHDMQPHASPGGSRLRRSPVIATRRMVALTGGLCAGAGGMVLIRHLSAGSAGSASTMQPPSGNFGGCANTMQYDYSGTNSVSLTVGEDSTAVIDGTDITVSSSGSNGVFATDSGTALVNDTSIETMADNSRGLDATYGGTILANKITADTQGGHSAIVATDRGGGSISLADVTLSTAGSGSPLLYSTGDIQVNNVSGTSSGSQIAGMEGLNTILIKDSTLESTVTGKTASDPIANGIIIYQSTSGDAEASTGEHATFQSVDSTLSSAIGSGSMFYFTNTTADVVLQNNTELDFDTDAATLTDNAAAGSGTGTASDATITVNVDGTSTWGGGEGYDHFRAQRRFRQRWQHRHHRGERQDRGLRQRRRDRHGDRLVLDLGLGRERHGAVERHHRPQRVRQPVRHIDSVDDGITMAACQTSTSAITSSVSCQRSHHDQQQQQQCQQCEWRRERQRRGWCHRGRRYRGCGERHRFGAASSGCE